MMNQLASYQKTYTITTNYLDRFDDLSLTGMLDLFQDIAGRHAYLLKAGFLDMKKQDLIWVIARNHVKVIKEIPFGEDLIVKTWPLVPTRFYFDRIYQLLDQNGELLASARSRWLLVDSKTRKMAPSSRYNYPLTSFANSNPFKEDFPSILAIDESIAPIFEHRVLASEIDHNEHFNNTRYAELVYNSIRPKRKNSIEEFMLYYHSEVKLNETISVRKLVEDNVITITGTSNNTLAFSARVVMR